MKRYIRCTAIATIVWIVLLSGHASAATDSNARTALPVTAAAMHSPLSASPVAPIETPSIPCNIVFETDRDGNHEVYSMAPDGSQMRNLTENPAYDAEPAWSPDGSRIAFVSNRLTEEREGGNYILIMDADGSNVHPLTFEDDSAAPDWSHDGSQITYSHHGDIYIIPADGSGPSINLTKSSEQEMQPAWSPDDSQIAWLRKEGDQTWLFVMNADGSHVQQLTQNGNVYDVFWTIDGEIFTHWDHPDGVCSNCVMQADGSNVRNAGGKGGIQQYLPFKTVDGERVECVSVDILTGDEEIYLVGDIYPDNFLNLTKHPGIDHNPDWPATCLSGFEGVRPEKAPIPVAAPTETKPVLLLGYAGDTRTQWQRKHNFQKACDELAIPCIYGEIPALLSANISALVLNSSPETITNSSAALQEAVDCGIPVFVLDAEIDIDGVYTITADHDEMLRTTLNILFQASGRSGEFAYFDFNPSQKDAQRIQNLLEKEYPDIQVVTTDTQRYNFNQDEFIFNDLVSAYPSLKAVWTNAAYTSAVFGIVNNISDPDRYPMLTCDSTKEGFYIWKDRITEHPGFSCVAVSNPPGIAYDAVHAAHFLLSGETIDSSALKGSYGNAFLVDFPVITNDNLLDALEVIEYEDDEFHTDRLMSPDEIRDQWFE
jgi:ABC-type sugar transport system substrate-binding protein